MYYEINVSLNGKHLFATDKRSITTNRALKEVYEVFKKKFPHEEGYELLVTKMEITGTFVDMEIFMEKQE